MSLPIKKTRPEFTYEELKLLKIYLDLDTAEGDEAEALEKLYYRIEAARAKIDPIQYRKEP